MKTTRTSGPNSWRNIGKQCANLGWALSRALTGKPGIDKLITEGFEAQSKKNLRKEMSDGNWLPG